MAVFAAQYALDCLLLPLPLPLPLQTPIPHPSLPLLLLLLQHVAPTAKRPRQPSTVIYY
jgi:hypothetical protein